MAVQVQRRYKLGEFELEPATLLLTRAGTPVHLTPKPFQVLVYLIEHRERMVTRRELLENFWQGHDVYDETLTKCVGAIRKALDDHQQPPRYIVTHWAEGYRYIGQVDEQIQTPPSRIAIERTRAVKVVVEEDDGWDSHTADQRVRLEAGLVPSSLSAQVPTLNRSIALPARKTYPSHTIVLALAGVLLAVAVGGWYLDRERTTSSVSSPQPIRSVAVMPLKNLTNDPADEYFSDGMTDALISALSQINGLKVISRSSTFSFKGKEVDPREVGRQLGVASVLEGSVRKQPDSVRIALRLVSTEDGRVIWSKDTQNRALGDLFAVQDEIAHTVAAGLRMEVGDQANVFSQHTANVEAYQLYLHARYLWNKRTGEDLKKAFGYFELALEKDPGFALAYVGLADCYNVISYYTDTPSAEAFPKAKEAATKALEIDESLAEAHVSLALVRFGYDLDVNGAEKEYRRALELNPNYATAHHWYGLYLTGRARFDEAVRELERARELDPLSLVINVDQGAVLTSAGRYQEGEQQLLVALKLEPNFAATHVYLGENFRYQGRFAESIAEYEKALKISGTGDRNAITGIALTYAAAGDKAKAHQFLESLKKIRNAPKTWIASIHAALGEKEKALEWLNLAYQNREDAFWGLTNDHAFDDLRTDPRFIDMVRRAGLS